jgi:hypothetical protein
MALSLADRKLTYSRDISTLENETSLLRLGDPFINLFEKYFYSDPRGSVFATWRVFKEFKDPWQGFILTFKVEANDEEFKEFFEGGLSLVNERRKLDRLFPPFIITLYLDSNLKQIKDISLLNKVKMLRRNEEEGDFALAGKNFHWLEEILPEKTRTNLCKKVYEKSLKIVTADVDTKDRISKYIERSRQEIFLTDLVLDRRLKKLSRELSSEQKKKLKNEKLQNSLLGKAVSSPKVTLDSMGIVVLCDSIPEEN